MSVTGESTLGELKSYISENGLEVATNVGGLSKRTKADILKEILETSGQQMALSVGVPRCDSESDSDDPNEVPEMALGSKFKAKTYHRTGNIKDSKSNERASTVVWIETPGGGHASGTYCKYDGLHCILTNNHVFKNERVAERSTAYLDFEQGRKKGKPIALDPQGFFVTNEDLDFTLVKIQDARRCANRSPTRLFRRKVDLYEKVTIIQHPAGGRKKIDSGFVREIGTEGKEKGKLYYAVDTLPGSSGSPIFNENWELVGIHHTAVLDKHLNGGTQVTAILDYILAGKKRGQHQKSAALGLARKTVDSSVSDESSEASDDEPNLYSPPPAKQKSRSAKISITKASSVKELKEFVAKHGLAGVVKTNTGGAERRKKVDIYHDIVAAMK